MRNPLEPIDPYSHHHCTGFHLDPLQETPGISSISHKKLSKLDPVVKLVDSATAPRNRSSSGSPPTPDNKLMPSSTESASNSYVPRTNSRALLANSLGSKAMTGSGMAGSGIIGAGMAGGNIVGSGTVAGVRVAVECVAVPDPLLLASCLLSDRRYRSNTRDSTPGTIRTSDRRKRFTSRTSSSGRASSSLSKSAGASRRTKAEQFST